MPFAIYTTAKDDMLDAIVFRHYGHTTDRLVERVLTANPGLSSYGPLLPRGMRIKLPEIAAPTQGARTKSVIQLWD